MSKFLTPKTFNSSQRDDGFSLEIGINLQDSTFSPIFEPSSPSPPVKQIFPSQMIDSIQNRPGYEIDVTSIPINKHLKMSSHAYDRKNSLATVTSTIGYEDVWDNGFRRVSLPNTLATTVAPPPIASSSKVFLEDQPRIQNKFAELEGFRIQSKVGPIRSKDQKKSPRHAEISKPASKKQKEVLNPPGGPGDLFTAEEEARLLHNHKTESDSRQKNIPTWLNTVSSPPTEPLSWEEVDKDLQLSSMTEPLTTPESPAVIPSFNKPLEIDDKLPTQNFPVTSQPIFISSSSRLFEFSKPIHPGGLVGVTDTHVLPSRWNKPIGFSENWVTHPKIPFKLERPEGSWKKVKPEEVAYFERLIKHGMPMEQFRSGLAKLGPTLLSYAARAIVQPLDSTTPPSKRKVMKLQVPQSITGHKSSRNFSGWPDFVLKVKKAEDDENPTFFPIHGEIYALQCWEFKDIYLKRDELGRVDGGDWKVVPVIDVVIKGFTSFLMLHNYLYLHDFSTLFHNLVPSRTFLTSSSARAFFATLNSRSASPVSSASSSTPSRPSHRVGLSKFGYGSHIALNTSQEGVAWHMGLVSDLYHLGDQLGIEDSMFWEALFDGWAILSGSLAIKEYLYQGMKIRDIKMRCRHFMWFGNEDRINGLYKEDSSS